MSADSWDTEVLCAWTATTDIRTSQIALLDTEMNRFERRDMKCDPLSPPAVPHSPTSEAMVNQSWRRIAITGPRVQSNVFISHIKFSSPIRETNPTDSRFSLEVGGRGPATSKENLESVGFVSLIGELNFMCEIKTFDWTRGPVIAILRQLWLTIASLVGE